MYLCVTDMDKQYMVYYGLEFIIVKVSLAVLMIKKRKAEVDMGDWPLPHDVG